MKSLKVFTALSLNKSAVRKFRLEEGDTLVSIERVQKAVESLSLGSGSITISVEDLKRKFGPWLKNKGRSTSKYDIFVSYYDGLIGQEDKHLAIAMVDMLSNFCYGSKFRAVNIFQNMDHGKSQSIKFLIKSTIVIPIFSIDALIKIKDHDPKEVNLVLLEWICALAGLECKQYSRINKIIPCFCRRRDPLTGKVLESVLESEEFKQIPDFEPVATLKEAENLLKDLNLFSKAPDGFYSQTVKSIVTKISEIEGFHVIDDKGTDFLKNAEKVIEFLNPSNFNKVLYCYQLIIYFLK